MKTKLIYTFLLTGILAGSVWAQTVNKDTLQKSPNVVQNTITIDSVNKNETINDIAKRVIESTYKNFPQQPGQPTIVINNIIVPPDYYKKPEVQNNPSAGMSYGSQDDEDFRAWQRERRYRRDEMDRNYSRNNDQNSYSENDRDRITFRERFAERKPRNSGTWVIPMAGIHASGFDADFKKDKYSGRVGWNAGLDIRMRAKRFFVQPGLHYFNSSMQITSEDSISDVKLNSGPRIHSLKLPVMIGIYLTRANKGFFRFNIKAGGVANYLLAVDKTKLAQFNKDNLHDFSYGLNGGIGLEFGFITIDITHEWGITDYFKDSNQKNNILRATLGFKI
ncbi:porin family protein [Dyadobacter sp. NIV53]|uniref:porin family protein n=1 Tax=Dyadobacter sp. NIV53 TaxID=2861765 RepID=UPI001C880AE5|nr:porin family protein [Dyadobacter sp. NIV53]